MSQPPPHTPPPPQRRMTPEDAQRYREEINSKLSLEERELLNQAGKKMRFWANVGIFGGFMIFSFPITVRPQIRYRFLKGMVAGTLGVFAVGPLGIYYGATKASKMIQSHPNHDHLLSVLNKTRMEILQGHQWDGNSPSSPSSSSFPSEGQWPSSDRFGEQQQPQSTDDDHLLTDDEINRQNEGATFTSDKEEQKPPEGKTQGSAWDRLRERAASQGQQGQGKRVWGAGGQQPRQEKGSWGDDNK